MPDLPFVRELAAAADYFAVVATTRSDGSVHASLVKAGVLDAPGAEEASVGMVVAGRARKLDHFRRAGQATVVFNHQGPWAAVEGPVRIVGPDDDATQPVGPILRAVFVAAGGTHDDWDEFDRIMAEERRCAVFVLARKIIGNG